MRKHRFSSTRSLTLALMLAALSALSACRSPRSDSESSTREKKPSQEASALSAKPKSGDDAIQKDPETESNLRTDEGEDLLSPESFDPAREKFREALKLNKDNARARFWLEWFRLSQETKGILNRVRPLYESVENGLTRYVTLVSEVSERQTPATMRYLMDGPRDIKTMDELQEWMDRFTLRTAEFRQYLKDNKHLELRVRVPAEFSLLPGLNSPQSKSKTQSDCQKTNYGPVKMKLGNCSRSYVGFNRADFETLQQMAGYYESLFTLLSAYRLNPQLITKRSVSLSESIELLKAQGYGNLRSGQQRLANFRNLTSDLAVGLKYLLDRQAEVCPRGRPSKTNRPGYLTHTGLCLTYLPNTDRPKEERALAMVESILADGPITHEGAIPLFRINHAEPSLLQKGDSWAFYPLKFLENAPNELDSILEYHFDAATCTTSLLREHAMRPYMANGVLGGFGKIYRTCPTASETTATGSEP